MEPRSPVTRAIGKRALIAVAVIVLVGVGINTLARREDRPERAAVEDRLRVVATTTIVGDLVRNIGGDRIDLTVLMGPGIDPHTYKPSEGDVATMSRAQAVFYIGHFLEGQMTEVFKQMMRRGIPTLGAAECIPTEMLLPAGADYPGVYDPHIWGDVALWKRAAGCVRDKLVQIDPGGADTYRKQTERYLKELDELDAHLRARAAEIPADRRVLISAHDAFQYFGKAYGFGLEVRGVLGLTTEAEAGIADIRELARFITERRVPAIFPETTVPPRVVQAVVEAARTLGSTVRLGGELFSDALGDPGSPTGTYVGMMRHNMDTIVAALKGE
jgi:manganese/zinc/iron transport system substrate-binding protein